MVTLKQGRKHNSKKEEYYFKLDKRLISDTKFLLQIIKYKTAKCS